MNLLYVDTILEGLKETHKEFFLYENRDGSMEFVFPNDTNTLIQSPEMKWFLDFVFLWLDTRVSLTIKLISKETFRVILIKNEE